MENKNTQAQEFPLLLTKKQAQQVLGPVRHIDQLLDLIPAIKVGESYWYKRSDVSKAPDLLLKKQKETFTNLSH